MCVQTQCLTLSTCETCETIRQVWPEKCTYASHVSRETRRASVSPAGRRKRDRTHIRPEETTPHQSQETLLARTRTHQARSSAILRGCLLLSVASPEKSRDGDE